MKTLVLCIDDKCGLAFNRRRQTKDRVQREHLKIQLGDTPLYLTPYTAKLMKTEPAWEELPEQFPEDGAIWVEREDPENLMKQADRVLLYRWNRSYPGDVFTGLPADAGFQLMTEEHFEGSSHDDICCEVYER